MKTTPSLLICLCSFFITNAFAQSRLTLNVDSVSTSTFSLPDSPFLKNADAVVISDKGSCEFFGSKTGHLTLLYSVCPKTL